MLGLHAAFAIICAFAAATSAKSSHNGSKSIHHSSVGSSSHHSRPSSALSHRSRPSSIVATGSSIGKTGACTITVTETASTTTPTLSTSTVVFVSTYLINGDDGIPLNPSTVPDVIQKSTSVTFELTYLYTVTRSSASTVTIPAPSGFINVQDSLPGAYFNATGITGYNPLNKRKLKHKDCAITTWTTTPTAVAATTTITVTKYTTLIVFPAEGTTIPAESYPTVTSRTTTTTVTLTDYPGTTFYTTTVYATATEIASTTTVYAACATDNFANYVGPSYISGSNGTGPADFLASDTAYECCVYALQNGGKAWAFSLNIFGLGDCEVWHVNHVTNACDSDVQTEQYVAYLDGTGYDSVKSVIGNGYCGLFSSSEPDPAPPRS